MHDPVLNFKFFTTETSMNIRYYTAVRRYEFYLRVVKTIFYERARRASKYCFHHEKVKFISSNRRAMFCLLYSRKQFKTQVSKINFRSIMVKTWLYFNLFHILFKLKQYLFPFFST